MARSVESNENLARAQRMIDELAARKAAKQAKEKARWVKYYEYLEKAVPFQGGAKHKKRRGHFVRYDDQ